MSSKADAHSHPYLSTSGGSLYGYLNMNGNKIWLNANGSAWIDANEYDLNIYSYGNSGNTYINLRATSTVQARNVGNTAFIPMNASAFNINSSLRYKTNVHPITDERARKILDVGIYTFDYLDDVVEKSHQYDIVGIIAEYIAKEFPDIVHYKVIDDKKYVDSVDLMKFIPYIMRVLQIHEDRLNSIT